MFFIRLKEYGVIFRGDLLKTVGVYEDGDDVYVKAVSLIKGFDLFRVDVKDDKEASALLEYISKKLVAYPGFVYVPEINVIFGLGELLSLDVEVRDGHGKFIGRGYRGELFRVTLDAESNVMSKVFESLQKAIEMRNKKEEGNKCI